MTSAEPMQIEKVKMKPSNGTVWNGAGPRNVHPYDGPHTHGILTPQRSPALSHETVSVLPNPMKVLEMPPMSAPPPPPVVDTDPDFPRRVHSARTPSLYDPSAPSPMATYSQHPQPSASNFRPPLTSRTTETAPAPLSPPLPVTPIVAYAEGEDIETRLADLNIGASAQAPSYAKIVRRD